MEHIQQSIRSESVLSTNKLIRNTYMLLSMTLVFSALMAGLSMVLKMPHGVSLAASIGSIVLLWFVLPKTANSAAGIYTVFGVTGLLGFGLGPILNAYLQLPNGGQLIAMAMGGTGVIFLGLSAYAMSSKRDFSFMGGFLVMGLLVGLVASLAMIFIDAPLAHVAVSGLFMLLFSGFILYDTSRMVHGHETNYVLMTVSLYLSIYNIFLSLLQILGIMGGDE